MRNTGRVVVAIAVVLAVAGTVSAQVPDNGQAKVAKSSMVELKTKKGVVQKKKVALGCSNPGTPQDVVKNPIIKNTTANALATGLILHWASTDGDQGTVKLIEPLAPGAETQGQGRPGNAYQCSAWAFLIVNP